MTGASTPCAPPTGGSSGTPRSAADLRRLPCSAASSTSSPTTPRFTAFAHDGQRRWSTVVSSVKGGFPAAPTLAGSLVYLMAHGISAVDKDTGRIIWQRELDAFATSVAVAGSRLYIRRSGGQR